MKVVATGYFLTLNVKKNKIKIPPSPLMLAWVGEGPGVHLLCYFPLCAALTSLTWASSQCEVWPHSISFSPSLLRHEEPAFGSLLCLFDMVGLEPVSGLIKTSLVFFWSGLLGCHKFFHSHQVGWAKAPGSSSNTARTWPWILTGLLGFNFERFLIQLANLPLVAFEV